MTKDSKQNRIEQFIQRRKALIELSKAVRPLVDEGIFDTVNEAIKAQYQEEHIQIEEFKTFHQWKSEGAQILKGSKAFAIWGQPRKASQVPTGSGEPEEYNFWPLCYLFANTQVYIKDETNEDVTPPVVREVLVNGDDI